MTEEALGHRPPFRPAQPARLFETDHDSGAERPGPALTRVGFQPGLLRIRFGFPRAIADRSE